MRNQKWIDRWRVVLLSAIGGLFSSAVYLMANRYDEYLADLRYQEELAREALNPSGNFACFFNNWSPLWWVNLSVWNVFLFVIMGVLVHRYLSKRVSSIVLLWQFIGVAVILAWGVTVLLGVVLDGYLLKGEFPLEKIIEGCVYTSNQISALKFIAPMFAANVVYATVMQVASKHYFARNL